MEDYEIQRARAWDDTLPPAAESDAPFQWQDDQEDGFQEVSYSKQKKKGKQLIRPAQPNPRPVEQARPAPAPTPAPAPVAAPENRPPRWPLNAAPRYASTRWRQQPRAGGAPQPRKHAPPPKLLIDHTDNEATLDWRARKPWTTSVRIPAEMVVADKLHNIPPTYERLASEAGAFIHTDDHPSNNASLTFGIWGESAKASEAKSNIITWIEVKESNSRSAASTRFPKIVSLTPTLRERANKKWERDIRKNSYRQNPPSGMAFQVIGSFLWPANEFRPEETFGMASEALDPIRMDQKCYITWDRVSSCFQVYGKESNVQSALLRIRKTFFHLCATQISPVRAYVWCSSADTPTHVFLTDHTLANDTEPKQSPRGEGEFEDEKQLKDAQLREKHSVLRIRDNISNALRNLHYLHRRLELRVRLGTFYLTSYKDPVGGMYELQEYEDMLEASQFAAQTSEEIGGHYIEGRLLELVQDWDDFCSPHDCMMESVSEVKPSYCAEFVFEDAKGDLRLSMAYSESGVDDNGKMQFTEPEKKWTRLPRDTSGKILDASLHDLATGYAWQFDLQYDMIENPLKLPMTHRQFPERVRIKPAIATTPLSNNCFFDWNPHVPPKSLRQVVKYQYMIQSTDYCLELSQYQDRVFTSNDDKIGKVQKPRWSLNVFRVEWDTMFARNASLDIGTKAEWGDDMENWFPPDFDKDEDGFLSLMEKLKKIEKKVRDAAAEEEEDMI